MQIINETCPLVPGRGALPYPVTCLGRRPCDFLSLWNGSRLRLGGSKWAAPASVGSAIPARHYFLRRRIRIDFVSDHDPQGAPRSANIYSNGLDEEISAEAIRGRLDAATTWPVGSKPPSRFTGATERKSDLESSCQTRTDPNSLLVSQMKPSPYQRGPLESRPRELTARTIRSNRRHLDLEPLGGKNFIIRPASNASLIR